MPLTEKSLIAGIRSGAHGGRAVTLGIGDDCAILRISSGDEILVTTDFSLEGIHFRREWHSPEIIGHRVLVRGISDIAAMGGQPLAAFLSLALPPGTQKPWVDRFLKGLLGVADEFGVTLAGGDTAESRKDILADIVVIGSVPQKTAIRRSGAKPGDRIFVTGELGGSAAVLNLLCSGRKLQAKDFPQHFHPIPRIEVGRSLRKHRVASAMIDISDGLSTDLEHICQESGVGAEIQAGAIPLGRIGRPPRPVDLNFALHGGDDYELLFTVPRGEKIPRRIAGIPLTQIGHITRGKEMLLVDDRGARRKLKPQGWQHFRK